MTFGLKNIIKKLQTNGDLGQRMHDAFETLLKWGIKTVLSLASDLLI
jgi:hypothetical protein